VSLSQDFLKEIEAKLSTRERKGVRSEATIDFTSPMALLATNFAAFHEPEDDPSRSNVITFETKPKSGVTEYVPSEALKYLQEHKDLELDDRLLETYLANRFSKFHVNQISRQFKGAKNEILSKYSPFDFFNSKEPASLEKAIRDLLSDS
jgi:hypothetical protein